MVVIYKSRRCIIEDKSSEERVLRTVKSVKGKVKEFKVSIYDELVEIRSLIVKDGRVLRIG